MPPSVQRIANTARELGEDLCEQIVFIGGAVLPLLETDLTVLRSVRVTTDVDGVAGTTTYSKLFALEEALRGRKFRNVATPPTHIGRWESPSKQIFDLVSAGQHSGGNGSERDVYALEASVRADLPPRVRHVSAVGFLVLKPSAYADRGSGNPRGSKDLSDMVSLLATRPSLLHEVHDAEARARSWIAAGVSDLRSDSRIEAAVAGHIMDRDPLIDGIAERVLDLFDALVATGQNAGTPKR